MNEKVNTEVKVGNYDGELEELIKKYSDKFFRLAVGYSAVKKYALVEKENGSSYILVISQYPTTMFKDYNIIISVMGPEQEKARKMMQNFQSRIEIETRAAPEYLEGRVKEMIGSSASYCANNN